MNNMLKRFTADELPKSRGNTLTDEVLEKTRSIVDRVRLEGLSAVIDYAKLYGELEQESFIIPRSGLEEALETLPTDQRELLERTAKRIRDFAQAQLDCIKNLDFIIPGGRAGHRSVPLAAAGCYAPGGRYPLPSSVLMTTIPAAVAGVKRIVVASPKPTPLTLAAAAIGGAECLLAVGGAQAIAALAYGFREFTPCDIVVGPGNKWVTAAKYLVSQVVRIDMLAGPSELVILADTNTDARFVAADLLAQAEHDPDALPIVVSDSKELLDRVDRELAAQLENLPTRSIAEVALSGGYAVLVRDLSEGILTCNKLAPEHLQVMCEHPDALSVKLKNYGSLFIGSESAEVLGDYGAGPNHVLPTGGSARYSSGLSVMNFLNFRTFLQIESKAKSAELRADAAALADCEGLVAHSRAATLRNS